MTHSIPQDKESLIRIFSKTRDLLTALHEKTANDGRVINFSSADLMSASPKPLPTFANKEKFPLDFQLFMEIIGPMQTGFNGVLGVCIYSADKEDHDDSYKYEIEEPEKAVYVASDCNVNNFYFFTSTTPYRFCDSNDEYGDITFTEWFYEELLLSLGNYDFKFVDETFATLGFETEYKKEIDQRVDKLLDMIEKYNSLYPEGDESRIDYGPVDTSKIENFEDYPYDYQCFIREIGRLSYSPGLVGLSVISSPAALKDIPDNEPEVGDEFGEVRTFYGYDEWVAEAEKTENIFDHILVATDVCGYLCLAFNPDTTPYTPINIMEPDNTWSDSFLGYVMECLDWPVKEVRALEENLAADQKKSTKQSREKSPTDALRNIRRSKTTTEDHKYWFEEYSKSDFTRFMIIDANINWAYWGVSKYSRYVENKNIDAAQSFIREHKSTIEERMNIAHESLSNWSDIPQIMKTILVNDFDSTTKYINETLDFSDSAIFHQKLGLDKEESWGEMVNAMDRELILVRNYIQLTDEHNLMALYCKWVFIYYGLMEELSNIKDMNGWELFAKDCQLKLKSIIPTDYAISNAANATVMHLEIRPSLMAMLTDEYALQWKRLFRSASGFNGLLLDFTSHEEWPSEQVLDEGVLSKIAVLQVDASLAISELILNNRELSGDG
jgi:hypothetical protein